MVRVVYQHLPPPLTHAAATLRGLYLRLWRYGSATPDVIAEALERDRWTAEQWHEWQQARLESVLHVAATSVPYYRELWRKQRSAGDLRPWTKLENWPILTKDVVKASPQSFVMDRVRPRIRLFQDRTSGTSGTPLSVFSSRRSLQKWFGTFEARVRCWHGVAYSDRWVMFGGQLVVPFERTLPPYWVYNRALHQLYVSTHHISRSFVSAIVGAIRDYRPSHILGYPSSLAAIAELMISEEIPPPKTVEVVFCNSEVLLEEQRSKISRAFDCPVRDTYGMAEMVAAASECEEGSMHVWPDVGYLEVSLPNGKIEVLPATGGLIGEAAGELIATSLLHEDMLLVRYRTGDVVAPSPSECSCGRTTSVLARIGGRASDMVKTRDGRSILWLNPIFYGMPIHEAQIIQESVEKIVIKLVPSGSFNNAHSQQIAARLRERVGNVNIQVQTVPRIERGPAGKFRPVISKIGSPP